MRLSLRFLPVFLLFSLVVCPSLAHGDSPLPPGVAAILEAHCWQCHRGDEAESDLRLDSMESALRGGESGERTIAPGSADKSYLIERLLSDSAAERMPPDSPPLDQDDIVVLRRWIENAAQWKQAQEAIASEKIDHWSLQPLREPFAELPKEEAPSSANAIDHFVQSKLSAHSLTPSPRAGRRTLIRRLYLVMHGVPPSMKETDEFLADTQAGAWSRLVERVLASPRYGERWAAHWLDLARFGETHGFETNRERPNAYHYRDWVIRSLNQDKPYDQFLMEQLAGDQLGEPVGTSFLVAGPYDLVKGQDPLLRLMQRQNELADIINTTGTAMLGLTIGCARCHNHKFDPISQTDYYAMQAIFAGVQFADREISPPDVDPAVVQSLRQRINRRKQQLEKFRRVAAPNQLREPVSARHNVEQFPPTKVRFVRFTVDRTNASQPCIDELEIFSGAKNLALAKAGAKATSGGDFVHPLHQLKHINDGQYGNAKSWIATQTSGGWVQIELPEESEIDRIEWARDRQGKYTDRLAVAYRIEGALSSDGPWDLLASSANRLPPGSPAEQGPVYDFDQFPDEAEQGRAWWRDLQEAKTQLERATTTLKVFAGTFSQPGATHRLYRGEPTAPREVVGPNTISKLGDLKLDLNAKESERRLALARWIASPNNPLTPRVIVNRLWQHHFGAGLVTTPSDFGANGVPPTHPELLDWLATDLIANGWSLKHLHRRILQSATWQQNNQPRPAAMKIDADNRLLWRFAPRRLEAEGIRDCIVSVAGLMNDRMGGPGFSAFEVQMENVRHYFPKKEYGPEDWRRMIYMTKVRQEKDSVFGPFDCPDASQVVPKRSQSTTPLQALSLLNSEFVLQQAEMLGQRLTATDTLVSQVERAYRLCYQRPPEPDESRRAVQFINQHGLTAFARALLNSNEFVFIP